MDEVIRELVDELILEEKVALLEGYQSWKTNIIPDLCLPPLYITDGPAGVRKKVCEKGAGAVGLGLSVPATAFPAGVNIANSWDPDCAEAVGRAIGLECRDMQVHVLLAPAMNLKRDPRCGRNFEYFSEDPLLTGKLAGAYVRGVQSTGTAACPKHFALNNCESFRYVSDSRVDLRVARELYLKAFEICVKESSPRAIMCAYNKINGIHCSENSWLLNDLLRDEWGFDGLVMTDWGATVDRVAGVEAGMDLDMPGGILENRQRIFRAVQEGRLSEEALDRAVGHVLELVAYAFPETKPEVPSSREIQQQNTALAIDLAAEGAVLLKNEGLLPLSHGGKKLLVLGSFFEKPRYQGAGSGGVNPRQLLTPKAAFDAAGIDYTYLPGWTKDGMVWDKRTEAAIAQADVILFFGGLTEELECEGRDRQDLKLPAAQLALLERLQPYGKKTVAVLLGGSPFEMPFAGWCGAILHLFLPGQGVGEACRRLLWGEVNPSGKLSETWMRRCEAIPCSEEFGKKKVVAYREGLYVGYRYFDRNPQEILYPFGHGLSYTSFAYENLIVHTTEQEIRAELMVRNTGDRDGAEVVQLYMGKNPGSHVYKVEKELKAFARIFLKAGESRRIALSFPRSELSYYHTGEGRWVLENGTYPLLIGASSQDIRLQSAVTVTGEPEVDGPYAPAVLQAYQEFSPDRITPEIFAGTLSHPVPAEPHGHPFTEETPLADYRATRMGRMVYRMVKLALYVPGIGIRRMPDGPDKEAMLTSQAFSFSFVDGCSSRSMVQSSGGFVQMNLAHALPLLANGKLAAGIRALCRRQKAPSLPYQEPKK